MRTPVTIGVVGLGSRGERLVHALDRLPAADLRWVFDLRQRPAVRVERRLAGTQVAGSFDELLADEGLDAIAIATPVGTRFALALRALEAGKHVLVESPPALMAAEFDVLTARARSSNLRLMAGHELPFHPAVRHLRELLAAGDLGEVYYLYADRGGCVEDSEDGVLWDSGVEAVAAMLWLVGDEPIEASARGGAFEAAGSPDVVFAHLRFATGIEAAVRLSRLEPRATRRLTVVASRGMAIVDELHRERNLTVYGRGRESAGPYGDLVSPWLPPVDTVLARCEHFVTTVRSPDRVDDSSGDHAVVAALRALQRSLDNGGGGETLGDAPVVASHTTAGTASVVRLPVRSG
jgi:predicted dehydrogenase